MNTARILSIAAVAAFASMGAQAFEANGELYGSDFESNFQSTRTRAEVRAEGQKALPEFAKGPIADRAALVQSTRPDVVLIMGRLASQAVLQSSTAFGKLRGQVHQLHGVPAIVMQDAAFLLRTLPEKARAWDDLCLAMSLLQK